MRKLLFRTLFTAAVTLASFSTTIVVAEAAAPKKEAKKADEKKVEDKKVEEKKDGAKSADLQEVSDAAFGYKVLIPKGAQTLQKDEYGHVFSLPLKGGNEYNVAIGKVQANGLEDAVSTATMMGTKEIEKKDAGDYYLVVKEPQFGTQEVHVYWKGAALNVKCTGPDKDKAKLMEMCTSLKPAK
ncbi:MAG: hypothetical protein QM765_45520 [Myxococcales bacterium]